MNTGTPEFLSRRDRAALRAQYRKGETAVRIVQADLEGRVGLLAVTDRRVLFVARRVLRTFVREVARDQVERVTQRTERYGSLVLKTRAGARFEFWMMDRGAAAAIATALAPGKAPAAHPAAPHAGSSARTAPPRAPAPDGAVEFKASAPRTAAAATQGRPAPAPAPASKPRTPEGDSYLPGNTAERRARLDRQLALGTITKAEHQWQLDSLR